MKKIKFLIIMLFIFPLSVKADTIYSVEMNINIDKEGTAEVREVWEVEADSGSEWYKGYSNLGNSEIKDLKISMNGNKLQEKAWDIKESISEKSGYYGIIDTNDGIEICFGKKNFERNKFVLTYKITNFVFNVEKDQVTYFTIFPTVVAKKFTGEITGFYEFPDTLDVWGYGYEGLAYVEAGKIKIRSTSSLKNDNVTVLIKFPENTFDTKNSYTNYPTFDSVLNKAEEGKNQNQEEISPQDQKYYNEAYKTINKYIKILFTVVFIFLLFFIIKPIMSVLRKTKKSVKSSETLPNKTSGVIRSYGYKNNKTIDFEDINEFRELPCNGDIYRAMVLPYLNNLEFDYAYIIEAIILKMIKDDKLQLREDGCIDLNEHSQIDNNIEKKLYEFMSASSVEGFLSSQDFSGWCNAHASEFLGFLKNIIDEEIYKLKKENHITKRISSEECSKENVLDEYIYEETKKYYGLKKFLQEFSTIDERKPIEVKLWDEYLMFASLFGMAEAVSNKLNRLYPKEVELSKFNFACGFDKTFTSIGNLSFDGVQSAANSFGAKSTTSTSLNNALESARNYSSGGGGFSLRGSSGGGGGSFGGGGSAGGR